MSYFVVLFLASSLLSVNDAFNLRPRHSPEEVTFFQKGTSQDEDPIPDPTCKKGVVSPDMKVCCPKECGHCGTNHLCKDPVAFNDAFGLLADQCCKDRIEKKDTSCEKDHAPCVLPDSYKEKMTKWVEERPKRHAGDDCGEAVPKVRAKQALAMDKGKALVKIEGAKTNLEVSDKTAKKVEALATAKIDESKANIEKHEKKIDAAKAADKKKDRLTGKSQVELWKHYAENEKEEVKFYTKLISHSKEVSSQAEKGMQKVKKEESVIKKAHSVKEEIAPLNTMEDEAKKVAKDAAATWQQWVDATKDHSCGSPPNVSNAAWQCLDGNTKQSPKCHIICHKGFDGEGTKNSLRCRREGKFGKKLYGEWEGMATCVGRDCGIPPKVEFSKTVAQAIRYPHDARYTCHEGHSTDGSPTGPKAFNVPCDATGSFDRNSTHVCKPIVCGSAPKVSHTHPVSGTFSYKEIANYTCLKGFTTDETPGGLKKFSESCQASGEFTKGQKCKHVRCGPPAVYKNTDGGDTKVDQYFGEKIEYKCQHGYSLDQKPGGPDNLKYTLVCHADGEFAEEGKEGKPKPQCMPVCAGESPKIANGNMAPKKMCYGDSQIVTAHGGFSTKQHPTEGQQIKVAVKPDGTFSVTDEDSADFFKTTLTLAATTEYAKFKPVSCGAPPKIEKATTSFKNKEAVFENVLNYECADGFSTDKTDAKGKNTFSIQCEADGSFSKVPDLGKCVNIDDCDGHTCGPFGTCVDHIKNYTCDCSKGYEQHWDEKTKQLLCGNIDDCGPEACGNGKCIDGVDDYSCKCPEGYEQVDTEHMSGKIDHTCKAVMCGVPPTVPHGATTPPEASLSKVFFPAVINYQCALGHTLDATPTGANHFNIKCQPSKKFSDKKECKPIKCDTLPKVAKSSPSSKKATYNEKVTFKCDEGHTVDGTSTGDQSFSVTCQVNGKFGPPQACKPVTCGEPDEVPNAHRPSGALVYKDSVKYKCFDGFTLDTKKDGKTEFSIGCQKTGELTKVKQCLPKVCGAPPEQINAKYASTKDEGLVFYPMNTEVICRDGYTVGGAPTGKTTFNVACTKSGEFAKFDEGNCQPVRCGVPPPMANATLEKIKTPNPAKKGVAMDAFYFRQGSRLPKLATMKPDFSKVVDSINYKSTGGKWPGLSRANDFAVRFSGQLNVKAGDTYVFELNSDDGSILYMDGAKVVNNDGLHGMRRKQGKSKLVAGPHSLIVDFFERGGGAGCILKYKGKDTSGSLVVVPSSAMQTKGGHLNYEEKAVYKCLPGFTAGGQHDAPTTFNVECLPSGQLSAPSADMQCRNVNDCEFHTCGPKGVCIDLVGPAPAYTCSCSYGYEIQTNSEGEKHCGNKDDCAGKDCGVGLCVDMLGDYTCECPTGYYVGINPKDKSKTCVPVQCEMFSAVQNGEMLSKVKGEVKAITPPPTWKYSGGALTSIKHKVVKLTAGLWPTDYCFDFDVTVPSKKNGNRYGYEGTIAMAGRVDLVVTHTKKLLKGQGLGNFGFMVIVQSNGHGPYFATRGLVKPGQRQKGTFCYNEATDHATFIINGKSEGGYLHNKGAKYPTTRDVDLTFLSGSHTGSAEMLRGGKLHAFSIRKPSIKKGFVSFPTTLRYQCDRGYSIDGTVPGSQRHFQAQCKSDGQLWGMQSCQKVTCGTPTIIPFTYLVPPASPMQSVDFGEEAKYQCADGYTVGGKPDAKTSFVVACQDSGVLTDPKVCEPVKCGTAPYIPKARPAIAGTVYWGQTLKYQCDLGYTLDGTIFGKTSFPGSCLRSGKFSLPGAFKQGLKMSIFYFGMGGRLPNLVGRKPSHTRVAPTVNYRSTGRTWPGLRRANHFAVRFSGQLSIQTQGRYNFELNSDDGSMLYIDGFRVVNNDGLHGMRKRHGVVRNLVHGPHRLAVDFFERGGGAGVILKYRGRDSSGRWRVVPSSALLSSEQPCKPISAGPAPIVKNAVMTQAAGNPVKRGMKMEIFYFRMGGRVPNLAGRKPSHTRIASTVNYRNTGGTWPGLRRRDNFAVRFSGQLNINRGGKYLMELRSDDGSILYVDGFRTVNNDGLHGWRTRRGWARNMKKGSHAVIVDFFERGGHAGILLRYRGADTRGRFSVLPSRELVSSEQPKLYYPNGVEYRCKPGYSSDGSPSSPTKITSMVNALGQLVPALPKECKVISYTIKGMIKNARNGAGMTGVQVIAAPAPERGFKEEGFYFRRTGRRCPNLTRRRPDLQRIVNRVWYRSTGGHWPGFRQRDHFAVRWTGTLTVRSRGTYWWHLVSDDGSKLWVDNRFVVNNDGLHGMRGRTGRRWYWHGQHALRLEMFEHGGGAGQYFKYRGPDTRNRWTIVDQRVVQAVQSNIPTIFDPKATTQFGFYTLKNIPAGPLKLMFKANWFINNARTVHVSKDINAGGVADINMSPIMAKNEWRAVLKWGGRPGDLDTYARWGWSKTCWYKRRQRSSGITGVLEQDRATGFGPETLHLSGLGRCWGGSYQCDIKYMINDKTGKMFRHKDAQVTLYNGAKVAGTFKIKDCKQAVSRNGKWWHPFTIDGRRNRLKWSCGGGRRSRQFRHTLRFDAQNNSALGNVSMPMLVADEGSNVSMPIANKTEQGFRWDDNTEVRSDDNTEEPMLVADDGSNVSMPIANKTEQGFRWDDNTEVRSNDNTEEIFRWKEPKVPLVDRKLRGRK